MKDFKVIFLIPLLLLSGLFGFGQDFFGNTSLGLGYYHLGSYSKERPIVALEQTVEMEVMNELRSGKFDELRLGIGTGVNIYPSTLAIPVFANVKYQSWITDLWGWYLMQSYVRYFRMGELGFSSNRNLGEIGFAYQFGPAARVNFGPGYLFNWDGKGGVSLSGTFFLRLDYDLN